MVVCSVASAAAVALASPMRVLGVEIREGNSGLDWALAVVLVITSVSRFS